MALICGLCLKPRTRLFLRSLSQKIKECLLCNMYNCVLALYQRTFIKSDWETYAFRRCNVKGMSSSYVPSPRTESVASIWFEIWGVMDLGEKILYLSIHIFLFIHIFTLTFPFIQATLGMMTFPHLHQIFYILHTLFYFVFIYQ